MIVITGAAGFIASQLVKKLNEERFTDLILVDDFSPASKEANLANAKYTQKVHRDVFHTWLKENSKFVQFVFHLGARTDTTEFDEAIFERLNLQYSKDVWKICAEEGIPLVYASSAATYGEGELGYNDDHAIIPRLKPLNPYGVSKNEFDKWVLQQEQKPYFWAGLKFFNVYGPHENHKGRMASVIFHAYHQIKEKGSVKLFRSHKAEYKDGEQLRDFVYVKDVVEVCYFLLHHRKNSAIYNLGTGQARSFNDLVKACFKSLALPEKIEYIDIPEDIREKYQYFTEANMNKLKNIGYEKDFCSLEAGVADYIKYLKNK